MKRVEIEAQRKALNDIVQRVDCGELRAIRAGRHVIFIAFSSDGRRVAVGGTGWKFHSELNDGAFLLERS